MISWEDFDAVERVVRAAPDVFNHNIETVRRLFKSTRPNGDYERSLRVIGMAREIDPEMVTKSGVMVGMGETEEDVLSLMDDLRGERVDCQIMTIGQYLSPKKKAIPVREYIHPDVYARYRLAGEARGFRARVRRSFREKLLQCGGGLARLPGDCGRGKLQGDPEGPRFYDERRLGPERPGASPTPDILAGQLRIFEHA